MKEFIRGLPIEPSFEHEVKAHAGFHCICGNFLQVTVNSNRNESISEFVGTRMICRQCEKIYSLDAFNSSELVVTFDTKKSIVK